MPLAALGDLVGRDAELAVVDDLFAAAVRTSSPQVLILSGEAGIGKTRLLRAAADRLAARPEQPLVGYGAALSAGIAAEAYGAVREGLRSLVVGAQAPAKSRYLDEIGDALRTCAPDWLEAIPMFGSLLAAGIRTSQHVAAGRASTRIDLASPVQQFVDFVSTLASTSPLALVLDDLHWADNSTIDVALKLALHGTGPMLLVLAYREVPGTRFSASDRVIHDARNSVLRYRPDAVHIALDGLTEDELLAALRDDLRASGPVSPLQLRRVVDLAGGNPLLAESLLLASQAEDGVPTLAATSRLDNIEAVMDIGLSKLTPEETLLLEACAVVGPVFEVSAVARALDRTEDEVFDELDLLAERAELVHDAPERRGQARYTFHHPILAEVLRDKAAAKTNRWRRLNGRLVDMAGDIGDETDWDHELFARMASYAIEAERSDLAHRWALQAARLQIASGSFSTALHTARAALDAAGSDAEELGARLVLIECLQTYADYDLVVEQAGQALAALRSHDADGRPPGQGSTFDDVELQLLRGLRMTGRWADVTDRLPDLLERLRSASPETRGQALMLLAEVQLCGPAQDLAGCEATLRELLSTEVDLALRSRATGHLGLAALARHDPVSADTYLRQAIEMGRATGLPYSEYEAVHWLSKKQIACLELDDAIVSVRHLQQLSEKSGVAGDTPFHDRDLGRILGLVGELEEAVRLTVRYLDASGSADGVVAATFAFQLEELGQIQGRQTARWFLASFSETAPAQMYDSGRRDLANRLGAALAGEADTRDALEALGISPLDRDNAYAIFTFDVPDLDGLRRRHA